jgi:hypothetical protein
MFWSVQQIGDKCCNWERLVCRKDFVRPVVQRTFYTSTPYPQLYKQTRTDDMGDCVLDLPVLL